jgi:hypothetical protein
MFIIHKRERLSPDEGIGHCAPLFNQFSEMTASSPTGRVFYYEQQDISIS